MQNKLYVGNLSYSTTDDSLNAAFADHGQVVSAKVVTDRNSGRSRGFGFVEMSTEEEANEAIAKMDNTDLEGRTIQVRVAQPPKPRTEGGFQKRRFDGPRRSF